MTKTQTSDILQHLKEGRRLTQKEAINEYGAYRLSGIIYALRNQGHEIASIPLSVPTRYNTKKGEPRMANIVEYKLGRSSTLNDIIQENQNGESFDHRLRKFINEIIK